MTEFRIGVIGGCGVIGSAILNRLVVSGAMRSSDLIASGTRPRSNESLGGIRYTMDNERLVAESRLVVLSIRPQDFRRVHLNIQGRTVISVMAGVTAEELRRVTNAGSVIRTLPNAAAAVGKSFTPYYIAGSLSREDREIAEQIYNSIGESAEVFTEDALDYLTGLTGSGLGFVALLADAMITHARLRGFDRALATKAVRAVIDGSGTLIGMGPDTPREMTEQLKGYRGTTEAALTAMEGAGFVRAVGLGLDAAEGRARSMAATATPPSS